MRRVTREVTREVMSNMNWIILALLAVTMTAVAQQPASAPQNPQPVAATEPGQTAAQPSAAPSGPPVDGVAVARSLWHTSTLLVATNLLAIAGAVTLGALRRTQHSPVRSEVSDYVAAGASAGKGSGRHLSRAPPARSRPSGSRRPPRFRLTRPLPCA